MVRRVTTNGMMMSYKSNLMNSYKTLGQISEKVTTQRNFNSYAESPAKASQAFQLRRERWRTETQIANSKTVTHKFRQAWNSLEKVYQDLGSKLGEYSGLVAMNGDKGAGRSALGDQIIAAADSMVFTMNSKYGDRYIFSAADGDTVPFDWSEDGELLYRGMKVDENPPSDELLATLKEQTYVDLGMGMTENDGELITSSAYPTALNGLEYLGYGKDEDGDPKNVISIMRKMGEIYQACDPDSGAYDPDVGTQEDAERLQGKLHDALNELHARHVELDTRAKFVLENQDRLESLDDTLNEQIVDMEDIDPADAITTLMWAQYSYNAALRIGTSILSQSLIDYMN